MTEKIILLALCSMLLAPCSSVDAQQSRKIARIGYLERTTASGSAVLVDALRQELARLGWIEGKNIAIEYRFADQNLERLSDLAAELVRLKVDVIVTGGFGSTRRAKEATVTIPIVMAQDPDPVANGLVVSLAQPGGNVTGLSSLSNELNTKRLEILKDAVPRLTRVAYLQPPGDSVQIRIIQKELRPAALALKLKLEEIETQPDAKGLESAFQIAKQKQVGAILPSAARPFFAERKRIVELAGRYRLPAIYPQREFVDEGGLMFYGADYADLHRRAATYVDKILKGARPADLPVEQPKKFELIINLQAAKQIGLTLPPNVLVRADKVIK
jgi:putative tryptophan/tyrosine transport system substrate-binding protein